MVRAARAPQRHLRPHPRPRGRVPRGSPLIRRPGLTHRRRDAPRARRARHLRGRLRLQHERRDVVRAEQPVPSEPAGRLHQRGRRVDALGDVPWAGLVRRRAQRGRARADGLVLLPPPAGVGLHHPDSAPPRAEPPRVRGLVPAGPAARRGRRVRGEEPEDDAQRQHLRTREQAPFGPRRRGDDPRGFAHADIPLPAPRGARCCSSRCRASRTSSTTASTR